MKHLILLCLAALVLLPGCGGDDFDTSNGPNGLITNQYAFYNPGDAAAVRSLYWDVTSGSFFTQNGYGWTGIPDVTAPDRYSEDSTGSWVFRMRSTWATSNNVRQELGARINAFHGFPAQGRPAVAWDGVVIWPRYKTEFNLYFAYILRKDGRLSITKKCQGGPNPVNGGTYYAVGPEEWETTPIPTVVGQWYSIGASVKDNPDGSVTIKLYRNGVVVVTGVDPAEPNAIGHCAPHRGPAKVGLRSDNVDANLRTYRVTGTP